MAALESMKELKAAAAEASKISMQDLEAAAQQLVKPEGLTLKQTEEGGKTRWSFQDEAPPQDERPINDDVAIKSCGATVGVGLFARRKLEGGSVILRNEPIAHAARGFDGARCDVCLAPVSKSVKCKGCAAVVYCGKACATSAASKEHVANGECAAAAALPKILPTCLLAARVLRKMRADPAINKYVSALKRKSNLDGDDELQAAAQVVKKLSGENDESACASVLAVLQRNAHSVCDDELREVGVALYPRAVTAANHSCRPNVWPRFRFTVSKAPVLEYAVLSSVEANKELTHEYADLLDEHRRESLRKNYGFVCACDECAFASKAREAARSQLRTKRDAMEAHLKREDWEKAADLAEDVARLEGFWAPGHPYTALHRLRCAKLQNLVGNETAAQVHIMLALVRLVVSHGKESSLAKEAADMQARVIHKREGRTLVEDASSDDDYDWRKGMRPW